VAVTGVVFVRHQDNQNQKGKRILPHPWTRQVHQRYGCHDFPDWGQPGGKRWIGLPKGREAGPRLTAGEAAQ